mgnify:CR=1 FL=1
MIDKDDLKSITKKNGWLFDWKSEYAQADRDVYKLTIIGNSNVVQGLISITEREDHVYMHLIESAPFNLGRNKVYLGVPGNLVAFVCRISFHRRFEGYVSFTAKTQLIEHYKKTLGAVNIGGHLMVINTESALNLVDKYFKLEIMGLIREPLDVDFFVDPKPLTENEKKMISDFIKEDKKKRKSKMTSKKGAYTQHAV